MKKWERHPVSALFSAYDMKNEAFEEFADGISRIGLQDAILLALDKGELKIADGWNRYRACLARGIEPKFREWNGQGSLIDLVFGLNVRRRHLNEIQRAMLVAEGTHLAELEEEAKSRQRAGATAPPGAKGSTSSKLAATAKVGARTMDRAKKIVKSGVPELKEAARTGKLKGATAARIAGLDPKEQRKAMEAEASKVSRTLARYDRGECFAKWDKYCAKLDRQMRQSGFVTTGVLDKWDCFTAGLAALAKRQ